MSSIIKSATVKVMNSHNYNHFEASMQLESEEGVTPKEMDAARKECQRLVDKSIKQYDTAKSMALKQANLRSEKSQLEREVSRIKENPKETWSVTDKAKVKALEDHDWDSRWDYDDDEDENY
jgi:hypothetical protein